MHSTEIKRRCGEVLCNMHETSTTRHGQETRVFTVPRSSTPSCRSTKLQYKVIDWAAGNNLAMKKLTSLWLDGVFGECRCKGYRERHTGCTDAFHHTLPSSFDTDHRREGCVDASFWWLRRLFETCQVASTLMCWSEEPVTKYASIKHLKPDVSIAL